MRPGQWRACTKKARREGGAGGTGKGGQKPWSVPHNLPRASVLDQIQRTGPPDRDLEIGEVHVPPFVRPRRLERPGLLHPRSREAGPLEHLLLAEGTVDALAVDLPSLLE